MATVGFIGLGIMGMPMATHLIKAGHSLMVSDVESAREQAAVSLGAVTGSAREIGTASDVVFTMLPDGRIVQDVLFGDDGVAAGLTAGKIVCDFSSVLPSQSQLCHAKLAARGVGFVDAPVSGGETGAIDGTLAIMCGGSAEDYNRLLPYFNVLGSRSTRVGGSGSGSVTKLANQIIVNLGIAAVAEALLLATKAGTDPATVFQAIRGGLAGSAVLEAKAPMMCARNFKPGGKISINYKDIGNVMAYARDLDLPLPFTGQLQAVLASLMESGHANDDHAGIVQYVEKLAGIEVKSAAQPD